MNETHPCQHCGGELPPTAGKSGPLRSTCDPCKRDQARARGRRATRLRRAERQANPKPRATKHKPGDRHGQLVMIEHQGVMALWRCDCGNVKRLRIGNVTSGRTLDCSDPVSHGDTPKYDGAHGRVRSARGPAKNRTCALGCGKPAAQWAYRHGDHDQHADAEGREAGRLYSADPAHYWALCRSCHTRWDGARRNTPGPLSLAHVALYAATTPS